MRQSFALRSLLAPSLLAPIVHHRPLLRSSLSHHQLLDEITHPNPAPTCPENAATFRPLQVIGDQLRSEASLDPATVVMSLKRCRGRPGLQIHALALSSGLDAYVIVSNSLMNMYAKSGSFDLARKIFDSMPCPDVVSWNTILSGFASGAEALEFAALMRRSGVPSDPVTFTMVLAFSADLQDLESGQQLHCLVLKSGFDSDIFVGNALITAYSRAACADEAKRVFDEMAVRDLVSWNSLICGLTQDGDCGTEAIEFFLMMVREEGVRPDRISFASVISACGHEGSVGFGCQVHGFATKVGVEDHSSVSNVLMSMYYKHGHIVSAKRVFENMTERDVIAWTTMISIEPENAIPLFNGMRQDGVQPNDVTFVALIFAVSDEHLMRDGQMVHGVCFKTGIAAEVNVSNSLITMYAKLKSMEEARRVFDGMHRRETVSWNALLSGFAQNGLREEALEVFSSLIGHCKPNQYTFGSVLSAITAAQTVSLTYGQGCHGRIIRLGLNTDAYVSGALIDMYAKRGSIDAAQRAFDETVVKRLVGWTAIISAHAKHGNYEEVMSLFEGMKHTGVPPDHITFLAVLVACGCKGMVDEGRKAFDSMVQEHEMEPWAEHYACVVDMLGKAGRLDEAEEFLRLAPTPPGVSALQSLLGACRVHGNADMGSRVAEALMELEPGESGAYVLMSNLYADMGDWENVAKMRRGMRQRGVRKEVGFSWVDAGIRDDSIHMHKFSSGDRTHPWAEEIHSMARSLGSEMKARDEDWSDIDLAHLPNP
ncbi:PPR repeat [Musa troglodytarum]|uniref:PPR repeat n=1 Tax=Musa troglodytarum TaxID=320322 RepID=A0A9E7FT23_9LILI|nr:PPR repeat [Musa troglodytarum]